MNFNRRKIAEFKREGGFYIPFTPQNIKDVFYSGKRKKVIERLRLSGDLKNSICEVHELSTKDNREEYLCSVKESKIIKELMKSGHLKDYTYRTYEICKGNFKIGFKYILEGERYYMFIGAESYFVNEQCIAIGKAANGKIYLILEEIPLGRNELEFYIIPEECIDNYELVFNPQIYNNSIIVLKHRMQDMIDCITEEDIKIIEIAYKGIEAFNNLIQNALM